jgi:hypothetical protein
MIKNIINELKYVEYCSKKVWPNAELIDLKKQFKFLNAEPSRNGDTRIYSTQKHT